jgi:hypothetical protein
VNDSVHPERRGTDIAEIATHEASSKTKRDAARSKAKLDEIGKEITARIEKMRAAEATAMDKAGAELKRAEGHRIAIMERLKEARKHCRLLRLSFNDFKAKYAPDLGRSSIYRLLAIADGRTTQEQEREKERVKKQWQRAAKRLQAGAASAAGTGSDPTGIDIGAKASPVTRNAANAGAEPPVQAAGTGPKPAAAAGVTAGTEKIKKGSSAWHLAEFAKACELYFPKLSLGDMLKSHDIFERHYRPTIKRLADAEATKQGRSREEVLFAAQKAVVPGFLFLTHGGAPRPRAT